MQNGRMLWVFDGDDTLWCGSYYYSLAVIKFLEWLHANAGLGYRCPDISHLYPIWWEIKKKHVALTGFALETYLNSFRETFEKFCELADVSPTITQYAEVERFARIPFDPEQYKVQGPAEGAIELLFALNKNGDKTVLLTKGDPDFWPTKLAALRLDQFFRFPDTLVIATSSKTPEVFSQLRFDSGLERAVSVGNAENDILPAVEVGYAGIHITEWCGWAYEFKNSKVGDSMSSERVRTFRSLKEILPALQEIQLWIDSVASNSPAN